MEVYSACITCKDKCRLRIIQGKVFVSVGT